MIPVETMILPRPTSGETIPPKANPSAPSSAEAVPALSCSQSIASVLEAVKVSPSIDKRPISSTSYIQKLQPETKAIRSNAEKITHSIFYTAITRAKEKLKIF